MTDGPLKTEPPNELCDAKRFAAPRRPLLRRVVSTLESLFLLAPLPLITGPRALRGEPASAGLCGVGRAGAVRLALAALICGFSRKMRNCGSLAKWICLVPRVDRFRLFEMPPSGYAGCLPFGIECAAGARIFPGYDASEGSATAQQGEAR